MNKMWGRFGITLDVSDEEKNEIISGNTEVLVKVLKGGKWKFDGETYFPSELEENEIEDELTFEL